MMGRLLILAVGLAIGAGCSGGDTTPTTPGPPPPPPPPPAPNTVNVSSNQFTPPDLSVSRNTTVTWAFQSGTHNVTFEDGQGSSGNQSTGTHTRQFGAAGTFRYQCTLHSTPGNFTSGMVGQISVTN
jgi:plastocyanin